VSAKNKLKRFEENKTFLHVIQPEFYEVFNTKHHLHGKWHKEFWGNNNPIVLEVGCGKGEYTVALAKMFPNKNFIGIDIKGARFWRGAKTAQEENLKNVAFIRTRVEFLESFFAEQEVSEIWITFPDPQKEKRRTKKRLTSTRFLNMYYHILHKQGCVHLKTDSLELFAYTSYILRANEHAITQQTNNLYASEICNEVLSIKTHYEKTYLQQGKKITYTQWHLHKETHEPEILETDDLLEKVML
jgi:tRNA (guanine-N7-)-methyltransferase